MVIKRRNTEQWKRNSFEKEIQSLFKVPKQRVSRLGYDVSEVLHECRRFPKIINDLVDAMKLISKDSEPLWDASCEIGASILHFKYHFRRLQTMQNKLSNIARNLPPLKGLSDEQVTDKNFEKRFPVPTKSL